MLDIIVFAFLMQVCDKNMGGISHFDSLDDDDLLFDDDLHS